jgi:REP element-mobilizing transposase RayT
MTRPKNIAPIEPDCYHVYNRAVYGNVLFATEDNYSYFMKLVYKHLDEVLDLYTYCLLPNHFHFLVKTKNVPEQLVSKKFNSLFSSYAQAFNKQQKRYGGLFQRPFKRKKIEDSKYLRAVVAYIHKNPQSHEVKDDFVNYKWSGYSRFIEKELSPIQLEVIGWFGDREEFKKEHLCNPDGAQSPVRVAFD